MKFKSLWQFFLCFWFALFANQVLATDLKIMISAGFYGVYEQMVPAFEQQTGYKLITTRGPSIGDSPEAIPTRLASGQQADVIILDGESAENLAKRGFVRPESITILAFSQIGAAVKQGAPKPDISTVDAFRNALLAASSIAYSDSGSGTYIANTMFNKLGILDQVK